MSAHDQLTVLHYQTFLYSWTIFIQFCYKYVTQTKTGQNKHEHNDVVGGLY
jgi:hypothetical protein